MAEIFCFSLFTVRSLIQPKKQCVAMYNILRSLWRLITSDQVHGAHM